MLVANYYNNNDVRIEERPVPKIGKGELLVKIRAASICGSDVMEWYRIDKVPRVLGHELAGEIEEVGEGLTRFKKGDRVCASHHVPCFDCHYCHLGHHTLCSTLHSTNFDPGGFAQWIRIPRINIEMGGVYPLPDDLSYEEAALTEPLACILRGQKLAHVRRGQTVLVLGCGPAGLLHIAMARHLGVRKIVATDLVDLRLKMAKQLGADLILQATDDIPKRLQEINHGRLADIVIVCAGAKEASHQALRSADRGGTVLFFAPVDKDQQLLLPMNDIFWQRGITLMSSYAANPAEHLEALRLIHSGKIKVKPLITHRLGFSEAQKAFNLAARGQETIKVILDPWR